MKVENRTKLTLEKLLIEYVHDGSIIYSDCWKAYSRLSEIFMDHKTVNHSLHFVDPNTNVHTNTIEGTWFGVKQQVSNGKKTVKSIDAYLIRFVLERNYGKNMFFELLKLLLYNSDIQFFN